MLLPRPARRWVALAALVATAAMGACGEGRSGGPRGEPEVVVRSSPDRTFAATAVSLDASAADAQSTARVVLVDPPTALEVRGPGPAADYPELADPLALVDMVRGAVAVEPYGGQAIRGVSSFRYELVVNVDRALAASPSHRRDEVAALAGRMGRPSFYADVWVDGDGRLRRIQVPVDKATKRPGNRDRNTPAVVTVDLFDYEAPET